MTIQPSLIYGLDAGRIAEGGIADLVIFNLNEEKKTDTFASKADNSPFKGQTLPGMVKFTISSGRVVYRAE